MELKDLQFVKNASFPNASFLALVDPKKSINYTVAPSALNLWTIPTSPAKHLLALEFMNLLLSALLANTFKTQQYLSNIKLQTASGPAYFYFLHVRDMIALWPS
jgi:hypothetical protein